MQPVHRLLTGFGANARTASYRKTTLNSPPYHGDCIFPDTFVFQLRRILFFTSANVPVLTDRARKINAEQVDSPNSIVAACASAAVSQAQDHALNALVLEQGLRFNKACLRISIPFP